MPMSNKLVEPLRPGVLARLDLSVLNLISNLIRKFNEEGAALQFLRLRQEGLINSQ